MSFYNKYDLLNSKEGEGVAENSPLWTLELWLMSERAFRFHKLLNFIAMCQTSTAGLYHQRPEKDNNGSKEDYMSPDQLIAFVGALYIHCPFMVKPIWKYLWTHFFTYNNLTAKTNIRNIQQPAAVFFTASCAGHKWAIPILSIVCFVSCFSDPDQSTGKLKAWTMIETLKMKKTKKICNQLLSLRSNFKNWNGNFIEYFPKKNHPIHLIALRKKL